MWQLHRNSVSCMIAANRRMPVARCRRYTDDQLRTALKESRSIFEMLPKLGLSKSGGNHRLVKLRVAKLGLDTSHLLGRYHMKGKHHDWAPKRPFKDILVENSDYTGSTHLKRRLLKEGLLKNECQICGQPPVWNGRPLVLILDHVNGHREDNRIGNLRIICRHCDSQLDTFAGRNSRR